MMDHKRWLNIIPTSYKERALKEEEGWGARAILLFQGYFLLISRFEYWVNGQVLDSLIHLETISGKLEWLKFEKKIQICEKARSKAHQNFLVFGIYLRFIDDSWREVFWSFMILGYNYFWWNLHLENNLPFENVFK